MHVICFTRECKLDRGRHFLALAQWKKNPCTYGTESQRQKEDTNERQKPDILTQSCGSSALDDSTCVKQLESNVKYSRLNRHPPRGTYGVSQCLGRRKPSSEVLALVLQNVVLSFNIAKLNKVKLGQDFKWN